MPFIALKRLLTPLGLGLLGLVAVGQCQSAAAADPDDVAWVHCTFPGQVRRLGAFSTSVTPRRTARATQAQCRAAGGEYVEPQNQDAAVKMWLPMATEGLPEAQSTVGDLFQQNGKAALAKYWYEKAAAQGDARAMVSLAGLLGQAASLGGANALNSADNFRRMAQLVASATGGLVAGLSVQNAERLRIDFVSPDGAAPLPRQAGNPVVVSSEAGATQVVARVVSAAKLKSVRVNGQAQSVDESGLLTIPVTVELDRTTVLVQADDERGEQAQAQLTLLKRSAPPLPLASAASTVTAVADVSTNANSPALTQAAAAQPLMGKRYALVIANQHYQHWPKLETPQADAQAVSEALQRRFGFDVTVLQDATRQQLLTALGRLRQQVGAQDQVVVYYAGHGQMDNVTARGYWIPVDGDQKDIDKWVSVIDVTDQLSAMSARHVLVIADSCYSGTLTRSLIPAVDQALTAQQRVSPLAQLSKLRARVAMTSGGMEPVADGGSVDHSLFARSLLDVLAQVEGPVAAQELFQSVSSRFAHLGKRLKLSQQPQYAPIGFAGHEAGDFVLTPI